MIKVLSLMIVATLDWRSEILDSRCTSPVLTGGRGIGMAVLNDLKEGDPQKYEVVVDFRERLVSGTFLPSMSDTGCITFQSGERHPGKPLYEVSFRIGNSDHSRPVGIYTRMLGEFGGQRFDAELENLVVAIPPLIGRDTAGATSSWSAVNEQTRGIGGGGFSRN